MFSFHERTRRWICRVLFLLLGVGPMGAVLAWGAVVNSSSHRQQIVDRVESSLNATLRASAAYQPRAELLRLDNLELLEIELGQRLFRAARVEVVDDAAMATRTLSITTPELYANPQYWRELIFQQIRLAPNSQQSLRLYGADLAIVSNELPTRFDKFDARFEAIEGGRGGQIRLTPHRAAADQAPIALQWTRTLVDGLPTTSFELRTADSSIDWNLCAELMAWNVDFGPECQFTGILRAAKGSGGWYGEVVGRFSHVDMEHVSAQFLGGRIRGQAAFEIEHGTFHDGQIAELKGALRMGKGKMNRALFHSLAQWLSPRGSEPANATAEPVDFDELACEFTLSPGGLSLSGRCEDAPAGTILQSGQTALLREPGVEIPVAALVNALSLPAAHRATPHVPATIQTRQLLDVLPLPRSRAQSSPDSF